MRQKLAPMLFDDTEKQAAEAARASVVAPAQRSEVAIRKQTTGFTPDGLPVHSFRTLLANLATLTRNPSSPRLRRPCRSLCWRGRPRCSAGHTSCWSSQCSQ